MGPKRLPDNQQSLAGTRESSTDSQQSLADSRKSSTDSQQSLAGDRRTSVDDRRLSANDRRLSADDRRLSADDRRASRRGVLGVLAATALAGCNTTDQSTDTPTATDTPTGTDTATPTQTDTPTQTGTDTPLGTASQTATTVVRELAAGEYERAKQRLDESVRESLQLDRLRRLWAGMLAQHGEFGTITGVERTTLGGTPAAAVGVRCAADSTRWVFPYDEAGSLVGIQFPADYSPPSYADRSAITERSATVAGDLPGVVTLPSGDEPVPGVVLVHGSGPVDRDETVGPNKTFRDLALGLTARGVAVLRYDKRTYASEVPTLEQTLESVTVSDAVAALDRLGEIQRVDRRVVVGHSLGGMATPRILTRSDAAAGVLLAANASELTGLVVRQVRHQLSVAGGLTETDERQIDRIQTAFDNVTAGEYPDGRLVAGRPAGWWRSVLAYDQVATAQSLDRPLRVVQGTRDYQIPSETEFSAWRDALADRESASFRLFDGLSHHFHPGQPPSLGEEYLFHDNVAQRVVADVADWIRSV